MLLQVVGEDIEELGVFAGRHVDDHSLGIDDDFGRITLNGIFFDHRSVITVKDLNPGKVIFGYGLAPVRISIATVDTDHLEAFGVVFGIGVLQRGETLDTPRTP